MSLVILSQALMTAFCVILFGTAFGFGMLFNTRQFWPSLVNFPQALMTALCVIWFGTIFVSEMLLTTAVLAVTGGLFASADDCVVCDLDWRHLRL